jgi:hypothetical protein
MSSVSHLHELTYTQLHDCPDGTALHFTSWPGRPSVPVTVRWSQDGNITLPDGSAISAFPDELTTMPREGLGGAAILS